MLVGRTAETARIDALLEAASQGEGGALVIRGEAGIGKTALLQYALSQTADMRVLSAAGIESEAELAFGGLLELLRPILAQLEALPPPQAQALGGALALGPSEDVERFAVAAGVLNLVVAAAADQPLLGVIDDVQWLDTASREALLFTARRLGADRVALLLTLREGVVEDLDRTGLPEIRLAGLSPDAAATIAAQGERAVDPSVARRLHEATGGNPLALVEVSERLTPGQLAGRDELPEPLPSVAGLEHSFLARTEGLPPETRTALLLAAASGSAELASVARALELSGSEIAALEPAERAGLVACFAGRIEFRHPLVRSAIYYGASPPDRRGAHALLARALVDDPVAEERRAWHLASAAAGPDEEAAAELEAAAQRGRAAAKDFAYERAARLTPDPERRARRLLAAANAAGKFGRPLRAVALCREALDLTRDEALKGDIHAELETALYWTGDMEAANRVKMETSVELEPTAPAKAAHMRARATASLAHLLRGEEALRTAASAADLLGKSGADDLRVPVMAAQAQARSGVLPDGRDMARGFAEALQDRSGDALAYNVAELFLLYDEVEPAKALLSPFLARARANGELSEVAFYLVPITAVELARGRLSAALAAATESLDLAEELQEELLQLAYSVVVLAEASAALGRADEARAKASRGIDLARRCGSGLLEARALAALGSLELGLGRPGEAVEALSRVAEMVRGGGYRNPLFVPFSSDLAEALARAGRRDEAMEEGQRLAEESAASPSPFAFAAAARVRGIVAKDDAFTDDFDEALAEHEASPRVVERARTELAYGERLRRAGERREARIRLAAALETFERTGAAAWAERAREELRASGERVRTREAALTDELTPQELQVALIVAEGVTTKEAAGRLFLSPKTIEFHLGRIYRKLGIRSRAELARRVAQGDLPGLSAVSVEA